MYGMGLGLRLAGFFAVATLPIGILTALFVGLQPAVAVFVIGWLLLTPGSAILFGTTPGMSSEMDELIQEEMERSINEQRESRRDEGVDTSTDPVETLRQRYASGEIDDHEFEQKLETILELESLDPEDEQSLRRTLETLHTDDSTDSESTDNSERSKSLDYE